MEIREQLGIHPGTELVCVVEGDAVKMIPVSNAPLHGRCIVEHMRGGGSVRMTTDDILALTRGDI